MYNNDRFIYSCGNKLLNIKEKRPLHTLFLFDLKELTVAEIYDDKSFNILCCKNAGVGNKHRQGGQSSQRFERERRNQIVAWFKRLDSVMTNIDGNIIVGSHEFYKRQFFETLTAKNSLKVREFFNSEYCNESGVYQYVSGLS